MYRRVIIITLKKIQKKRRKKMGERDQEDCVHCHYYYFFKFISEIKFHKKSEMDICMWNLSPIREFIIFLFSLLNCYNYILRRKAQNEKKFNDQKFQILHNLTNFVCAKCFTLFLFIFSLEWFKFKIATKRLKKTRSFLISYYYSWFLFLFELCSCFPFPNMHWQI